MSQSQKKTVLLLLLLSLLMLFITDFPNSIGSKDRNMLGIFSQDEFAQYPHVVRMLRGGESFPEAARRFFFYQHYYYGFPFYFLSALVLVPLRLLSVELQQTSIIMLLLRQFISVLPMLLSISVLVYLQTRFERIWTSPFLFLFLMFIPAVFENNLWWHPDSLTILFISLTFFFLIQDDFKYKKFFWGAAVACGLAIGTKLIGLFFFLTIPVYLLIGYRRKKIDARRLAINALIFFLIMAATIVVSNPILLTETGRRGYLSIQSRQSSAMSQGWSVFYQRGLGEWIDLLVTSYAPLPILILSALAVATSILKDTRRVLTILILTWVIPFSLYLVFFIVIRPTHFLLPIMLPLLSTLALIFPENLKKGAFTLNHGLRMLGVALLALILAQNIRLASTTYLEFLDREQTSTSLSFYRKIRHDFLSELPAEEQYTVLRDVRVYVKDDRQYQTNVFWGLISQEDIDLNQYDFLFLWKQRILDFSQSGLLENAIEPTEMELTIDFFSLAKEGNIPGYTLIYKDAFGYFFAINKIAGLHFSPEN